MAERELLVRILGDDRDLQRALGTTERRLESIDNRTAAFGKNLKTAFAAAGIAVGTQTAIQILSDSVDAASALNEELSKSREVFGESAGEIEKWSRRTAESFGISQRAALQATGVFGNLFRVVGLLPKQSADMSRALVELAADLASFNNADPTEVLVALRSGLIGEAEPLRRFGVLLSEARVQQVALANTGKENVKQLTNQEKTLARFQIILRDTATAQGDFARTSESLANQQRILAAQVEDLEAALGTLLLPTLTDVVSGLTDIADAALLARDGLAALKEIEPIELDIAVNVLFKPGGQVSGLKELTGRIGDAIADAVESGLSAGAAGAKSLETAIEGAAAGRGAGFRFLPSPQPDRPRPLKEAAEKAEEDAKKDAADARRARRAKERSQKEFDEFIKGQGLKLDRAEFTATLQDDLAVLRAIESAIERRIEREGRTFDLVEQLTRVRAQIARTVQQQAEEAERAGQEAFNATIDALTLDLEIAQASKSLADDQAALRGLEQAILRRIQVEGQTTDLLRQLFDVRQQQAEVAKRLREQQRERRQGEQFKALGLTEEGEERVASIAAIRKRARGLIDELKASDLPPDKIASFVKRLSVVFTDQFDVAGREVRQAILNFFGTINDTLDDESKKGPLTKTTALNTKKFLEGLGLSPEEFNALRSRLSSFNSAGAAPGGFMTSGFNAPTGGGFAGPIVVESNVTVTLDGQKVGKAVTRSQQKSKRRNPQQKRGPNRKN